jgi:hypothetical protein
MNVTPARRYRCAYHPTDAAGYPQTRASGELPTVQILARSAEQARRVAHAVTGCPIEAVERLEGDPL